MNETRSSLTPLRVELTRRAWRDTIHALEDKGEVLLAYLLRDQLRGQVPEGYLDRDPRETP